MGKTKCQSCKLYVYYVTTGSPIGRGNNRPFAGRIWEHKLSANLGNVKTRTSTRSTNEFGRVSECRRSASRDALPTPNCLLMSFPVSR